MFVCRHIIKFFEGITLVKTNPPSVKAGYGPATYNFRRSRLPGVSLKKCRPTIIGGARSCKLLQQSWILAER